MCGASLILGLWLASPPPPSFDPELEPHPIEGPMRPPQPDTDDAPPGIEFAADVEDDQDGADIEDTEQLESAQTGEDPEEAPTWPDPGTAPNDGLGMIAAGLITMPSAALMTWILFGEAPLSGSGDSRVPLLVAGAGMGAIGAALVGVGLGRRAKLHRWAVAYRVRPRAQGAGLLTIGGVAVSYGGSLIASGIVLIARDNPYVGGAMMGIGAVMLGGVAPPALIFGKRRRADYLETGGWVRPPMPPLPQVEWSPRVIVSRELIGLGVAGRF